jgi:hypothetical protein
LPILDTATALVRRLLNKRPLFVSDRGHIYDQMLDRGISLTKTVTICYLLAAFYAVLGVVMGITTAIRVISRCKACEGKSLRKISSFHSSEYNSHFTHFFI